MCITSIDLFSLSSDIFIVYGIMDSHLWASQRGTICKESACSAGAIRDASYIPGWEDYLEATDSITVWKISWTEEPGRLRFIGL